MKIFRRWARLLAPAAVILCAFSSPSRAFVILYILGNCETDGAEDCADPVSLNSGNVFEAVTIIRRRGRTG